MTRLSTTDAFLRLVAAAGVRYIFTSSSTAGSPLLDALRHHAVLQPINALHEVPVIAMADGYAQATGALAVANVHVMPGHNLPLGPLHDAWRSGTPLLMTASQPEQRLTFAEADWVDALTRTVEPYVKTAITIDAGEELPRLIRRAIQQAVTPPTGPVYVALPPHHDVDLLEYDLDLPLPTPRRQAPPRAGLAAALNVLLAAARPAILVGPRLGRLEPPSPLVELLELLGADLYTDPVVPSSRLSLPADHPLYGGVLPPFVDEARALLSPYDVVLTVAMDLSRSWLTRGDQPPLPARLVALEATNPDPAHVDTGTLYLVGDPFASLEEMVIGIAAGLTAAQRAAAAQRLAEGAGTRARWAAPPPAPPMSERATALSGHSLLEALAAVLPVDAVIVDEATSALLPGDSVTWPHTLRPRGSFRGLSPGWAPGAAVGVALALPGIPVVALLHEHSLLAGYSSLWTAVKHQIPALFIVSKDAHGPASHASGGPTAEIDYRAMGRALGITAWQAATPSALQEAIAGALHTRRPVLIDARLDHTP